MGAASALALDPIPPAGAAAPPAGEAAPVDPKAHKLGRSISLVRRHAERHGVPPDLAQAVMMLESGGDPTRTGPMGEVGLMQVRLATAMMLGFRGDQAELFDPALNATYGVAHLAQAWRIAGGDACRTLVKYRSHYGEERSARFPGACARLGRTLAAMNSPLAGQTALAQVAAKPEEAKPAPAARVAEAPAEAKPVETSSVAEVKPAPMPASTEIKAAPAAEPPAGVAVTHPAPPARPTSLAAAAPAPKTRAAAKAEPKSKPKAAKAAKAEKPDTTTTGSTKGVTLVAKTRSGGSGKAALTCTAKTCTLERGGKD
jgi:hypothetical protein